MKRKNLFLIPALFLISTLCLINVSCFSGFQEKGEVTVTFSESTLRQIMARGGDISAEPEDFDFDPTANMVAYYAGMTSDAQETFALYVYQDATYAVYAVSKMEAIAKDLKERYGNLTEEDYLSNPKLLEILKNPMALYEKAIISMGSWSQSGDSINIKETHYLSAASDKLTEVSNPSVIATISENAKYFTVQSNSGYTITFYAVKNGDVSYEDEPTESATLSVKLVAGNMSYEKTFTVYSNTKKAHVEFTDIPVGVTAKVFATVYLDEPHGGQITFAKGESEEFVIQSGPNYAKIIMRASSEWDEPDDLTPPSGTPTACYIGECKNEKNINEYILAFYENNQYAVWELPEDSITNKEEISIDVLQYGKIVSFGKYSLYITDDDMYQSYEYRYSETAYYDQDSETYRASQYGGSGSGAMPCEINFASLSGLEVRFTIGDSNSHEEFVPPSGTLTACFPGAKAENPETVNYMLALYDSNEYSLYEFDEEDIQELSEEFAFSPETSAAQRLEIISRMLNYGTVIAFGSYSYSVAEESGYIFHYNEKAFLDRKSGMYKPSTFIGSCNLEGLFSMQIGDGSGLAIVFTSYESGKENDGDFTFIIQGFEKNDFTDLNGNTCNVSLYAITDTTVMQKIKTALANEDLTDAGKADVLIPIIEAHHTTDSQIASFQTKGYEVDNEVPTYEILDNGTIKWSVDPCIPMDEAPIYGILATVYFSKEPDSGFYEFEIGYAENPTPSSISNEVEIAVQQMNVPCNIYFSFDDEIMQQYSIRTAMSEIMMYDEENNIRESVLNELRSSTTLSETLLEKDGYEFDADSNPRCAMQNGVPFVTLYYVKVEPLDILASGSITKDNRSVIISMDYDSDTLYLNQGTFTFSATYPDGSELSESDAENIVWDAQLLYKGKSVNSFGEQYCEVIDNKLVLEKHMPLPSAGNYQILVTAKLPVYQNSTTTVDSSQTFDLSIGDRHIYDISDEYNDIRYAQSLHNVVITGDVTDADWEWTLDEQSSDHILQVLFSEHRKSLQKITFNGQFESPDYDAFSSSPLYDAEPKQPISFSNSVSIEFKDVASIGKNLFYGIGNLQSVKFTTTGSSFGEGNFKNCASLTSMDCTGVSTIGYETFRGNAKLTSIVLTGVTTIESYAFYGCTGLTTVTIPESVIEIGEDAFSGCENLNSVEFEVTTGWKKVIENNETLEAWEPDFTNTTNIAALLRSAEPTMPKLIRE